jgi:hypothetical protein
MKKENYNYKKPTLKEKVALYEFYLHKINMFVVSCNNDGIAELVQNADIWSYAHRIGNGELSDKKQQQAVNNAFWKLCDTPEADKTAAERQLKYSKNNK